jgi:hypothetical protein
MKASFSCSGGRLIGSKFRFVIDSVIMFVGNDVEQVVQSVGTILIVLDKFSYIVLCFAEECMLQKLYCNCVHLQLRMYTCKIM